MGVNLLPGPLLRQRYVEDAYGAGSTGRVRAHRWLDRAGSASCRVDGGDAGGAGCSARLPVCEVGFGYPCSPRHHSGVEAHPGTAKGLSRTSASLLSSRLL